MEYIGLQRLSVYSSKRSLINRFNLSANRCRGIEQKTTLLSKQPHLLEDEPLLEDQIQKQGSHTDCFFLLTGRLLYGILQARKQKCLLAWHQGIHFPHQHHISYTHEHTPLSHVSSPKQPNSKYVTTKVASERSQQNPVSYVPTVSIHLNHKPFSKRGVSTVPTVSNDLPYPAHQKDSHTYASPNCRNPTEVGGTRLLRKCASHLVMVQ